MYKQVIIAEKPSLGRAIVDAIPGKKEDVFVGKNKTHTIINDEIVVTWLFGHILEMLNPKDYPQWAGKWSFDTLPYFPDQFQMRPSERALPQFNAVKNLLKKASVVVNAGDPDREGQLLVDEVLEYCGWKGPTKRILLNATDLESSKKAIKAMRDNSEFRNLYEAGKCRSQADWLVGMNLTVAATKGLGDNLVSIGRVQTPVLALVVRRCMEIENFKVRKFFNLEATVKTDSGKTVKLKYAPTDENRIYDEAVAAKLAASIRGVEVILKSEQKSSSEAPPRLHTLASFQKDAGINLKMGAAKALEALQTLYEKQVTSYPRTDCFYLPAEQKPQAIGIATTVLDGGFVSGAKPIKHLFEPKDSIYDSKKVTEHHAIVPTIKSPNGVVDGVLLKCYELVAKRFILSLLPAYKFYETRISFTHDQKTFGARGEIPINLPQSWRALSPKDDEVVKLPSINDGEKGVILSVDVVEGKTTPPKYYTEFSLIEDMNSVAKYCEDPRLKQILKETSGIGTPATQASIIETLKSRGFIEVDSKSNIKDTIFGREVYGVLPASLKDVGMTAVWEETLKMIADGQYKSDVFMEKIKAFVLKRIEEFEAMQGKVFIQPAPNRQNSQGSQHQGNAQSSSSRKGSQSKALSRGKEIATRRA